MGLPIAAVLAAALAWAADPDPNLWGESAVEALASIEGSLAAAAAGAAVRRVAGILHHNLAAGGATGHADAAVDLLEPFVAAHSEDHVAAAYLGSARTLQGRDASNPIAKVDHVEAGMTILDAAVAAAADDLEVRIVRASNSAALPSMFEREAIFAEEVRYFRDHLPAVDAAAPVMRASCYLLIGDLYKAESAYPEAMAAWMKAKAADPASKFATDADARLKLFAPE